MSCLKSKKTPTTKNKSYIICCWEVLQFGFNINNENLGIRDFFILKQAISEQLSTASIYDGFYPRTCQQKGNWFPLRSSHFPFSLADLLERLLLESSDLPEQPCELEAAVKRRLLNPLSSVNATALLEKKRKRPPPLQTATPQPAQQLIYIGSVMWSHK